MSRHRHLELDFATRDNGVSWSGVVVLALGAAAMVFAVATFQKVQSNAARLEAQLGQMRAPARAVGAVPAGQAIGESVQRANAVAHQIARRWDKIFLAIESASHRDVALLAIEPEARKGIVRITAEARNKGAMLRYVSRLQAARPLERVLLESHEVRVQDTDRPVRFVVAGEWDEAP